MPYDFNYDDLDDEISKQELYTLQNTIFELVKEKVIEKQEDQGIYISPVEVEEIMNKQEVTVPEELEPVKQPEPQFSPQIQQPQPHEWDQVTTQYDDPRIYPVEDKNENVGLDPEDIDSKDLVMDLNQTDEVQDYNFTFIEEQVKYIKEKIDGVQPKKGKTNMNITKLIEQTLQESKKKVLNESDFLYDTLKDIRQELDQELSEFSIIGDSKNYNTKIIIDDNDFLIKIPLTNDSYHQLTHDRPQWKEDIFEKNVNVPIFIVEDTLLKRRYLLVPNKTNEIYLTDSNVGISFDVLFDDDRGRALARQFCDMQEGLNPSFENLLSDVSNQEVGYTLDSQKEILKDSTLIKKQCEMVGENTMAESKLNEKLYTLLEGLTNKVTELEKKNTPIVEEQEDPNQKLLKMMESLNERLVQIEEQKKPKKEDEDCEKDCKKDEKKEEKDEKKKKSVKESVTQDEILLALDTLKDQILGMMDEPVEEPMEMEPVDSIEPMEVEEEQVFESEKKEKKVVKEQDEEFGLDEEAMQLDEKFTQDIQDKFTTEIVDKVNKIIEDFSNQIQDQIQHSIEHGFEDKIEDETQEDSEVQGEVKDEEPVIEEPVEEETPEEEPVEETPEEEPKKDDFDFDFDFEEDEEEDEDEVKKESKRFEKIISENDSEMLNESFMKLFDVGPFKGNADSGKFMKQGEVQRPVSPGSKKEKKMGHSKLKQFGIGDDSVKMPQDEGKTKSASKSVGSVGF